MSERMFPIMGIGYRYEETVKEARAGGAVAIVVQIPWAMLAPHEAQAERNHSQTLERLASRGGLSPDEALAVLQDRRWKRIPAGEANKDLLALVMQFESTPESTP